MMVPGLSPADPVLLQALLAAFVAYCALAFLQMVHHRRFERRGHPDFPSGDRPVTVIMGILSDDPDLERYLRSVCEQDHPRYEVLLVSTRPDEPGAEVGAEMARRYEHVRHIVVGPHDPSVTVGKNHALLGALAVARHDIVLFADADVEFEPEWIRKMVSPIGHRLAGRRIDAVGAPIVVLPRNRLGRFFSLSTNVVTYLAAFTGPQQVFPPYVSGHSMAVERAFVEREVAPYWACAYNDDLILAYVLRERGRTLYYRRDATLRPQEDLRSWRRLRDKTVRWAITVRRFQHPDMRREVIRGALVNAQFAVGLALAAVLLLFDAVLLAAIALAVTWTQIVLLRHMIARRMGERIGVMILLTPVNYLVFGTFFLHHYLWGRRFRWGGHEYRLTRSFGMDAPRDDAWRERYRHVVERYGGPGTG